jgi:hypothetical protein
MNRLKSQLHLPHVLEDVKQQVRSVLLVSADDELIKAIVRCETDKLNGNHKSTTKEKRKLKIYENTKISFKSKRKI